jgi:Serine phosphatase RsbU, regulator of sigma subunit
VSDARNRFGGRLGEQAVLDIVQRYRSESPDAIMQRVFDALAEHTGEAVQRDDLALVIVRS